MTKRIFAAVIAIAMVCTMFAFVTSAAETTTVKLDASVTEYGWDQILNALNLNDYDNDEDGWKQVSEATNVRSMALYCYLTLGWQPGAAEYNSILYTFQVNKLIDAGMSWIGDRPSDDVRFCDYFQNTFGAVAYALRGGKQKAIDLWNQYCPDQPAALDGDTAFTYTNNTKYTDESFANALACLKAYMTYAQDNQVCNVGTAGRWTAQKARYASLENALKALEVKELPKTTVELDSSVTAHGWNQILNAINFNDYDSDEDGWKQVAEAQNLRAILLYGLSLDGWAAGTDEPWNSVLYLKCKVVDLIDAGIAWNGDRPADDVLVCDYMQNTFGAAAYALRGGKQKAVDLWNKYCPDMPVALDGDNAFTYTNNYKYTDASFAAALNALKAYMVRGQDNYVCNTGDAGRWTAQKARYAALETALQGLVEGTDTPDPTPEIVDLTGYTSSDATTQYLITYYNNIDVAEYRELDDVQNWARALKTGIDNGLTGSNILINGGTDVVTFWENNLRYTVCLAAGARTAADKVYNDATLWPQGTPLYDKNQIVYKAAQFNEVYDLWVKIRDEYRGSLTVKTSEVLAACESLKAKIQALEPVTLPFTQEQLDAKAVLSTYVPYYRGRIDRVVLPENQATENYKQYLAWVEEAEGYLALDWENGTSESYPSVETMHALVMPEAAGGNLETHYYDYIRIPFGLDVRGYDALVENTYNAWVASGLYTEESLAEVKTMIDNYDIASVSGARANDNTDEMVKEDIETLKEFLVEKPVVEPTVPLKVRGENITLQESISLFFAISDVSEYSDVHVEFTVNGETTTNSDMVSLSGVSCFKYANLSAKQGVDEITAVLVGTFNGKEYRSDAYTASVANYCYKRINSEKSAAAFKRVCVDLLNYCSAAQTYFNYKTETLANAKLTDEQKALGSSEYAELTNNRSLDAYTDYGIKAFNLVYEDVIQVQVAVEAADINGLVAKVNFDGMTYTFDTFYEQVIAGKTYYVFDFTQIAPTQQRKTFTVSLEKDGAAIGGTGTFSIESYLALRIANSNTNAIFKELLVATAKYGDSCAAYFG